MWKTQVCFAFCHALFLFSDPFLGSLNGDRGVSTRFGTRGGWCLRKSGEMVAYEYECKHVSKKLVFSRSKLMVIDMSSVF